MTNFVEAVVVINKTILSSDKKALINNIPNYYKRSVLDSFIYRKDIRKI